MALHYANVYKMARNKWRWTRLCSATKKQQQQTNELCNTSDCTKSSLPPQKGMCLQDENETDKWCAKLKIETIRSSNSWLNYHELQINHTSKNSSILRLESPFCHDAILSFLFLLRQLHENFSDSWPWHWISYHNFISTN